MLIAVATIAARWRLALYPGHTVRKVPSAIPRPDRLQMIIVPRRAARAG